MAVLHDFGTADGASYDAAREQLFLVAAVYANARQSAEALFGNDATVTAWVHQPASWPPSYMVAVGADGSRWVVFAGTSNLRQVFGHISGAFAEVYNGGPGLVNSAWMDAWRNCREDIVAALGDFGPGSGVVHFSGHSYGGAVAQIAGWEFAQLMGAGRVQVQTLESPIPFTASIPGDEPPIWRFENTDDVVPTLPASVTGTALAWDQLAPTAWFSLAPAWRRYGRVTRLTPTGGVRTTDETIDPVLVPWGETSIQVGPHLLTATWERLYVRWQADGGADNAKQILDEIPPLIAGYPSADWQIRELPAPDWLAGVRPNPFPKVFGNSDSNGGSSMANGISCKALLSSGPYQWSVQMIFKKTPTDGGSLDDAHAAFTKLMSVYVTLFAPQVSYGWHVYVNALRYNRIGNDREGVQYIDPDIKLPVAKDPDDNKVKLAEGTEPPFMGYLYKLAAGTQISRTLMIRPLSDIKYLDTLGRVGDAATLQTKIEVLAKKVKNDASWYIHGIDRSLPEKTATNVQSGDPVPAGWVQLTVAAHGLGDGDVVSVKGGKKEHKVLRGRFEVLKISDDLIRYKVNGTPPASGPTRVMVRKYALGDFLIDTVRPIALRKRDTRRPTTGERGSRRKRA